LIPNVALVCRDHSACWISGLSCDQYLNFAAVFRSRRRASKSGCDLTTRIIDSIAAIMTPGSISPSVHSRKGSRGIGKLSEPGSSRVADTSLDLGERSGSPILRNNRPQFGIFKISIRGPKKIDYVLPVGLGGSSSRVARGVKFKSNEAKSIRNSNLTAIQHLLVCSPFDTVKGVIVNDHQIEGRKIRGSLKLQKGIGFEKGPISQAGQNSTRRRQLRVGDQQIQIESVPQVTMQNNCVTSDH
jgi:hypothetical protein